MSLAERLRELVGTDCADPAIRLDKADATVLLMAIATLKKWQLFDQTVEPALRTERLRVASEWTESALSALNH